MNLQDGSENFRIISSRSQLKSDWSICNAEINRYIMNFRFLAKSDMNSECTKSADQRSRKLIDSLRFGIRSKVPMLK